jgi:hypothetical protein
MVAQTHTADHRHTEVKKLQGTITTMDALSQEGFSEIATIARLVLARLETPEGYRHTDDIAIAFQAIWGKAEMIQNCINSEAESVGCNSVNESFLRRWDAQREAEKETVLARYGNAPRGTAG